MEETAAARAERTPTARRVHEEEHRAPKRGDGIRKEGGEIHNGAAAQHRRSRDKRVGRGKRKKEEEDGRAQSNVLAEIPEHTRRRKIIV